ncbi:MAG: metallophosphoesterase family protein [Candidatus Omnitrophica bacterium]|nr:metallophosphoesterase family protein [Candidatus Omnitrophota bacterium]MCB9720428.1 metallophosphoesterase family protein [Candidatus Omnitrophota bacterium]
MPTTSPPKIAVLADAHANWPALEAVLGDLARKNISEIWYLGDFIGYGPYPRRVIAELKQRVSKAIVGNYDLNVLRLPRKRKKWIQRKDPSKMYSYEWTFGQLKREDKDYLARLPARTTAAALGRTFLLVHGSPEAVDEPLTADTPPERFKQLAANVEEDVILCGHTHKYFSKKIAGKYFVNPGSVGRSFDGNAAASYVILEQSPSGIAVRNMRVAYDVTKVIRRMRSEGFPKDVCESIEKARHLDDIQDGRGRDSGDTEVLKEVVKLARSCSYEKKHSHQVTRIALRMYDDLRDLHQLPERNRLLLQSASLLHDIGWVKGRLRHHKTARDIILRSFQLPLTREEKVIVALVARYHRRSLPRESHKYYADLPEERRMALKKLAAILRIADGLDRRRVSAVDDVHCNVRKGAVTLNIDADDFSEVEKEAALKKADLFRDIFGKNITINWKPSAVRG